MKIEYEAIGQASVVVHTCGCSITRIQGNSTANGWLQLHDAKRLPANASVPLRTWPIFTDAPFDENFQNDDIQLLVGCVLAFSSTRATLTISASTFDIYVNGESAWDNTGATVVGDYTTADEVLQVWAQDTAAVRLSPKYKLVRLEVRDVGAGGDVFVQVHASDTPATNKIVASIPLASDSFIDAQFGDGLLPIKRVDFPTDLMYNGCTIAICLTQNTYAAIGVANWYIKATYKAIP